MGMVLVTHDLGVVATRTDEIIVMYAGNVVERAPTEVLFSQMSMPYTEALLRSMPRIGNPSHTRLAAIEGRPPDLISPPAGCPFAPRCPYAQDKCHHEKPPLVEGAVPGHSYACWFPLRMPVTGASRRRDRPWRHRERARCSTSTTSFVSFTRGRRPSRPWPASASPCTRGETLGLVGESGCGKSTTGRAIVQVDKPTSGKITFEGTELTALNRGDLRQLRTQMQMIFQDPISSLNPRRRVADIVAEPLTIWKIGTKEERRGKVNAMLESVGIDPYRGRQPLPAGVLRRPVPAHQHRPGARARAQAAGLRRDRLGPRRLRAGPDPQPARGPQGATQPDAPLHRPRPGRGQERE